MQNEISMTLAFVSAILLYQPTPSHICSLPMVIIGMISESTKAGYWWSFRRLDS